MVSAREPAVRRQTAFRTVRPRRLLCSSLFAPTFWPGFWIEPGLWTKAVHSPALAAPPIGPRVRILDRTAQQPDARADRRPSSRVASNAADDRAARSAACCATPGIVHRATRRAAPVKPRRWRPGREELRELHRGFARAAGRHRRRRRQQTCCEHYRQAGRQISQLVWYPHSDHGHPPFSRQGLARIAEISPSLNGPGRPNVFNWRHISIGCDKPNLRCSTRIRRSSAAIAA